MKRKGFAFIMVVAGVLFLATGAVLPVLLMEPGGATTGIIGGADLPTYQFLLFHVLKGFPFCMILFGSAFLINGVFCLCFKKTVVLCCSPATSGIAVGLSATAGSGIVCVLLRMTLDKLRYPTAYTASMVVGLLCVLGIVILFSFYLKIRKKNWCLKGLILDIFVSILYLPAFFYTFSCLC